MSAENIRVPGEHLKEARADRLDVPSQTLSSAAIAGSQKAFAKLQLAAPRKTVATPAHHCPRELVAEPSCAMPRS